MNHIPLKSLGNKGHGWFRFPSSKSSQISYVCLYFQFQNPKIFDMIMTATLSATGKKYFYLKFKQKLL